METSVCVFSKFYSDSYLVYIYTVINQYNNLWGCFLKKNKMKKSIVLVAVVSVMFASCGRSGWSCKKRYCEVKKDKIEAFKNQIIVEEECALVQP